MTKGKDKNPFKFQGFSERIANIKLDISHRVEKRTSEPEEKETFCNEALNKWRELNCTIQFQDFCKEIHPLVQTLAQLVHHEQDVVAILRKHLLREDNSLALEPLLDILVQISRDLQSDFYPHFNDIFSVFVTLLSRNVLDSEILEHIFTTLGYLFKFLWRYMVKDIKNVFKLYSPLLSLHQKPYIRQFAADSFAFLMRKVKDHSKLLDILFESLVSNEDMVEGIGYLCFEMMKGVKKQFHSQTENILPIMLSKFGPIQSENSVIGSSQQLPWELVYECQLHTIKLMAKYTTSEGSLVVERSLRSQLMKLYNISEMINGEEEIKVLTHQLCYVLQLTNVWVSWKNGSLVSEPLFIFDVVLAILRAPQVAQEVTTPLLNLASSILLANFSGLHRDIHQKQLIKNVFQSDLYPKPIEFPLKNVFGFSRSLLKWPSFHDDILPPILTFCQAKLFKGVSDEDKQAVVLMLAEVVLTGVVNDEYGTDITPKKGLIFFPKCGTKSGGKILDCLLECLEVSDNTCLSLVWGVLVCLPCISPLTGSKCPKKILEFITQSLEVLSSEKEIENPNHWLFVVSQAVISYLVINPRPKSKDEQISMDFILQVLSKYPDNVHILHSTTVILSHIKTTNQKKLLSSDNLKLVYPLIKTNLSNPAHLVRQKTLEILKEFDQLEFVATEENSNPGKVNLFQLCLEAESTLPTFQHYRNKEILLRKLTYSSSYHKSLPELYRDITPRYLIGQLYINFSPIWKAVTEIIKSHALGEDVKSLWVVFSEHLEVAAGNAEKALNADGLSSSSDSTKYEEGKAESLNELFTSVFNVATGPREDNRIDHINFRYLLWKTMGEFPGIVELKSRDLVPLLLRFISNEYELSDDTTIPSQDIRKKELQDNNDVIILMTTDQSNHPDEPGATEKDKPDQVHARRRKAATRSLCVHLNLFSLFHNPKALSKEPQVRRIYTTMLSHRDSEVQKIAVKCMLTYKFQYVMPYRDNLERLLEDESFRDELALLTVEEGNATVDPAHREVLMPIIIRILYGKMQRWTGAGSSGKSGIGARRATVLRFLGSCPLEELTVFMDLILAPFKHLCADPHVIPTPRDLSSMLPIKKQLGFLNMMQHILIKLGAAADTFLPSLLQICLSLLSTCVFALEKREEVHPPHISQLKQIRQLAISRLIDFFEARPDYDYTMVCHVVYEAAVWPQLDNLEQESIQSPTPLMRLIHTWTKNPRYFPLLSRKPLNSPETSIMRHVFSCLNACNVGQSVVAMVMEMTDNLLSIPDDDDDGGTRNMMELGSELSVISSLESNFSYGTRLVLPHLSIIINHLSLTVKTLSKSFNSRQGPRKSKATLPKLELSILSKISPYVSDPENSAALIKLLLPFIYLRQREDTENDTLRTIKNLLSNVQNPVSFTKQLARLFSQFNARSSRQGLCEVFGEIARLDSSYEIIAEMVTQMNTWNKKKIEEPDYDKRMAGFTSAINLVSNNETGSPPNREDSPPTHEVSPPNHEDPPPNREDPLPNHEDPLPNHEDPLPNHEDPPPNREDPLPNHEDPLPNHEDPLPNHEDPPPQERNVQINFILPILHNCLFFVHRSNDMAIRDGAICCINTIIQRVAGSKESEEFDELIVNCMLPSCKLAMRSKNESARSEFLGILATMVRQFDHVTFEGMRILVDKDPEADFFENMRHIQLHRRIRALRRLESLCQINTFKPSTLMAFLLPLATVYLFDYSGNKDHNLVTQAIATVGAISACLPWPKYSHLLRLYLRMLKREKERQKTIVRVVVAILDGFHFDLSSYNITVDTSEPEAVKETPKQQQLPEKTDVIDTEEKQTDKEADDDEDDILEEDGDDDESNEVKSKNEVISEVLAKRIYETITTRILPQLNRSLTKKVESYHKLSHTKTNDEQEALRVPIALAMVKLLKSLPQHTLHLHLPGLLLRVCGTLKSRARDVRDTARDVLCQIALSLGTKYFSFIIKEMKTTLTRGYQLHVLGFTLHSLLDQMLPTLSPGDLDHCIPSITEILVEDLFGEVANEREVEKLANKLHEAKSSKSYESFETLARIVGSTSISLLVTPLQEVLDSNQSHKLSQRVEETLRKIGVGLQANTELSTQTLMVFIHRIIHEKLPSITTKKTPEKDEASDNTDSQPETSLRPENCYLISPSPVRGGKAPGLSAKTNAHIIVEFGLQMLNTALKRGKISGTDQTHLQMLDPFISVLSDCMQTKHTKVLTLSLRCLCVVIKLPLPSLDRSVPYIAKLLFKCLKKYATAGSKVGENYEMVFSAFKAMTVIIRDFNKYTIAEKHLQVLLGFVEEDVHDHSRQGTAFPLLKAILTRKLIVPEIHDVMKKVCQMSITGATPTVQQQCRQCVLQYMLDYPLGKKLQRLLEFYVSQLSYEHESGRESALDMMTSIFSGFPESLLFEYASFFFLPLTTRLVNDDSAKCRQLTAIAIKTLLRKLDVERRDNLFRMLVEWFSNDKVLLRRLAAQVCGQFVEVEGKAFDRRLPTTLSLIAEIVAPKQYETEGQDEEPRHDFSSSNRGMDHLLFNALTALAKILQESKVVWEVKNKKDMDAIWVSVESHLLYPHAWVRLVSCRLFGLLFAAWKHEDLNEKTIPEIPDYLTINTKDKVVQLCNNFCLQLESPYLDNDLSDQIIKNLVFIAKLLYFYDNGNHVSQNGSAKPDGEESGQEFTLKSLFSKMERLATHEASQTPKKTQKRSCVMRWLAALAMVLGKDDVIPYLREILQPIHRELDISTTFKDPNLQNVTQEVLDLVKGLVGREVVSRVYAELQRDVTDTKEKKRKKRALEAVADPTQNARRKMKRNLTKKETRKRKIEKFKPERKLKKTRTVEQDD